MSAVEQNRSPTTWPTTAGILALLIWSTAVAGGRSLTEQIGGMTATGLIQFVGGLAGCTVLLIRGKFRSNLSGLSPRYLFGCGILFTSYAIMWSTALQLSSNRMEMIGVGLVNYLWPMITVILSIPILGQRASWPLLTFGTLLGLVGVVLAMKGGTGAPAAGLFPSVLVHPLPYVLAGTGALIWGLYSNLSRRWAGNSAVGAVSLFMLVTGVVLLVLSRAFPVPFHWTARTTLEMLFMSTMSPLAYMMWELSMRKGDNVFVGACSYLSPVISTLVGALYLRIVPGASLWFGCVLVVAGAVMAKRGVAAKSLPVMQAKGARP